MISYRIAVDSAHAHSFRVTVTVPRPAAQQRLSLPVWIPGSYLVREFARHVSGVSAEYGGTPVALQQLDKATWLADCSAPPAPGKASKSASSNTLTVSYRVYAFDTSVRAAFLDARRGFFNGTGVFLRVEGREAEPQRMELRELPRGWQVATAMPTGKVGKVDKAGLGVYEAANYDELVDHPVELGTFWRGRFEAHGVAHEFIVAGALPDFDGERLLADTKRICEAEIAFWHGTAGKIEAPPFKHYVFMLNVVEDGYGGLEHRASTALIAARRDLPRVGQAATELADGYVTLLGLISHEYFHTWNVKRLKPSEFEPYDYTTENYTELLWFFEGFTSYYDDLLLLRAGLIDEARYLKLLGKAASNVLAMPGRRVQSVAQASFDAWVKYYRVDENTPNATVSYYAKGSLVALALDLTLRADAGPRTSAGSGKNKPSLDRVMRLLWAQSGGGPITEADVLQALHHVAGRSLADEFAAWVHGTAELPLAELLAGFGVQWQAQAASTAQRLGLRVAESALTGVKATHVLNGGAAEAAGLAPGDELLALNDWRLRRLDDALRVLTPGREATLLVSRDQRLLRLPLLLPTHEQALAGAAGVACGIALTAEPKPAAAVLARRKAWFAG